MSTAAMSATVHMSLDPPNGAVRRGGVDYSVNVHQYLTSRAMMGYIKTKDREEEEDQ